MGVVFAGILALLLLGMSAFASGSEIAFFSLSPTDIAEIDAGKSASDRNIQKLRNDSECHDYYVVQLCLRFDYSFRRQSLLVAVPLHNRVAYILAVAVRRNHA